jgi:hypothetical protein
MKTDIKTNIQAKTIVDGVTKNNILKLLKFENEKPTKLCPKTTGK